MKINSIVPWFGSNRMLAVNVGEHLEGCRWVGILFAGSMCEAKHINARTLLVNDLHRHVINLGRIVAHPRLGSQLIRRLRRQTFHPDVLKRAQEACRVYDRIAQMDGLLVAENPEQCLQWAVDYFTTTWMARNENAGCDGEFDSGVSLRYSSSGGDSAVRYRSATESLRDWRNVLRRATFTTDDVFKMLDKCKKQDIVENGIYSDPPFPGPGDAYFYKFSEESHRELAKRLTAFERARVVCRFYRHPLVEELYPASVWTWHEYAGRKQTNDAAPEVLLVKNGG